MNGGARLPFWQLRPGHFYRRHEFLTASKFVQIWDSQFIVWQKATRFWAFVPYPYVNKDLLSSIEQQLLLAHPINHVIGSIALRCEISIALHSMLKGRHE